MYSGVSTIDFTTVTIISINYDYENSSRTNQFSTRTDQIFLTRFISQLPSGLKIEYETFMSIDLLNRL